MLETTVSGASSKAPLIDRVERDEEMPSLNHSYVCLQLIKQLIINEDIEPLPELTLDIGNGITPDISVFPKTKIKPHSFHDILRFQEKPTLAIDVVSSSQTIQEMLQKATQLVAEGIKVVWTVEPYSRTVFVTTNEGEALFHEQVIESGGIKVDFAKVFPQTSN